MKKFVLAALVGALAMSAPVAYAGGPVIIEEGNNEVVSEAPRSGIALPLIFGLIVICAIACGGGDGGGGGTGGGGDGGGDPDPKG